MADELHKCQFWLPPKFVSRDHDETEFLAELTKRLDQYTTRKKAISERQFPKDINDPWKTNFGGTDRVLYFHITTNMFPFFLGNLVATILITMLLCLNDVLNHRT